jgi:hypothetical protein
VLQFTLAIAFTREAKLARLLLQPARWDDWQTGKRSSLPTFALICASLETPVYYIKEDTTIRPLFSPSLA